MKFNDLLGLFLLLCFILSVSGCTARIWGFI